MEEQLAFEVGSIYPTDGKNVCIADNEYIYICKGQNGFAVYDYSGNRIGGSKKSANGVDVDEKYIYLATGDGLAILDRNAVYTDADGNTVVEAESNEPAAAGVTADAAKAEAGTTAVTGSSANSQDVQTSSADAAAAGAAQQDEASAELQDEAGADAVLPESEAEEEVQEDPYKDVILPKSLPDEFYVEKDHTYAFYDASRYGFTTYKEVADFCRQQGGHLAVINNAAENNYLFRLLRDVSEITAFFGYSDEDGEGDWQWSDGDSSYTNWTTYGDWHLPDNGEEWGGDEDYAEFNYERGKPGIPSDGTWNDATFMENTPYFICEWEFDVKKAQEARSSQ